MTREEVQRMADAWKANDARNQELKRKQEELGKQIEVEEIEAGLYEE